MITLLLLVRAKYITLLFFAHIPFVVNRTFNATSTERLQQGTACQLNEQPEYSLLHAMQEHFRNRWRVCQPL